MVPAKDRRRTRHSTMGETSRIDPFPAIDRHGMGGSSSRWGLVLLSSPVQGRRKKNIPFPSSQVRPIIHFRDVGRITITTIRNNLNRSRIFSLRAKLQTQQFVLTPWCATMKANRKAFQGTETPNPLRIQRFQDHATPSLSTKRFKKTAPFSAVSGQRASRTHCNRVQQNREARSSV